LDVNLATLKTLALVHGVVDHHLRNLLVGAGVAPTGTRELVLPEVLERDHMAKHVFIARVSR
jgi:hypothetical protein